MSTLLLAMATALSPVLGACMLKQMGKSWAAPGTRAAPDTSTICRGTGGGGMMHSQSAGVRGGR